MVKLAAEKTPQISAREIGVRQNAAVHLITRIEVGTDKLGIRKLALLQRTMLVRLTPKSTRFGDDFVGTLAHWMLARLSPLHFGCCHEPVYSPSYVGATACPLIPSNDRNALNG